MDQIRVRLLQLLGVGCLIAGACTPDFEEESVVKDLRILGMRATPPEIIKATSPDVWPPVKVDALVVDPTLKAGETVEWEFWGCGVSGSKSVADGSGSSAGTQPGCCPFDQDKCTEDLNKGIVKLKSGQTTPDKIETPVELTKELYKAALLADSQKGLGGVPIKVELRVRRAGKPWQVGVKRLVYGVYDKIDLTCLPPLNQDSLDKCIQQQQCEAFLFVCVRDGKCSICNGIPEKDLESGRPKVANSNPGVNYLKVSEGEKKDDSDESSLTIPTTWATLGDAAGSTTPKVWEVKGGTEHFVLPKPDPVFGDDQEVYVVGSRVPTYDEAAQSFQYTFVLKENLTFFFFATEGSWSHDSTGGAPSRFFVDKKVKEISSRWTPPSLDQEGDPETKDANLWVVVHDDRGGVGWISIKAKIKKKEKKTK